MRPVDYAAIVEKCCTACGITKPVADFNKYVDQKAVLTGWRYYSQCRLCSNAYCREYSRNNRAQRNARLQRWRKANPEAATAKDRRARLSSNYGLTEDDAARLLARHDGNCWLCRVRPATAIDHDHATGHVRGMTCNGCNSSVLSRVDADPDFLARVAEYVTVGHAETLAALP